MTTTSNTGSGEALAATEAETVATHLRPSVSRAAEVGRLIGEIYAATRRYTGLSGFMERDAATREIRDLGAALHQALADFLNGQPRHPSVGPAYDELDDAYAALRDPKVLSSTDGWTFDLALSTAGAASTVVLNAYYKWVSDHMEEISASRGAGSETPDADTEIQQLAERMALHRVWHEEIASLWPAYTKASARTA